MTDEKTGAGASASAPDPFERGDPPVFEVRLWPHRSLTQGGATGIMAIVAAGLAVPLVFLHGSRVGWGMLPFLLIVLYALYWGIRRSELDGRLSEELRLWPDLITVVRREPAGSVRRWHANPFWVQPRLLDDAKVEKYLTLEGNGREIELGAFLSPEEREALYRDICAALHRVQVENR